MTVSEGWAIELCGPQVDLDDLRHELRSPFDPWVEDYEEDGEHLLLLRSGNWSSLDSTGQVMVFARRLIDNISGALLVGFDDAMPIKCGRILRFGAGGSKLPVTLEATLNVVEEPDRVRAYGTVGSNGAASQAPSKMQQRLAKAEVEEHVSDLLTFLARSYDWFDLFKAMEKVGHLAGGQRLLEKNVDRWEDTRRTANRYRHAPSPSFSLPDNPPTLEEARRVVIRGVRTLL